MEIRRINNGKIFYFGNDVIPKYSFNAKELDEETGMYYFEARYYRAPTFTSRDPLFEKYPSISPYAYCANNPVKYIDPSGEEMEDTDYRNFKGELLYKTNDGLKQTILVPEKSIPELKQKLEKGLENNVINDPEYNKQELHPLGKTPEEYKANKEGSKSNAIGDTWREQYKVGYEEGYNGKKNILKHIFFPIIGALDILNNSGGGAQESYTGWLAGKVEGNFDKRQGYINAMNPQSSFKNNEPIIKLNIKK